MCFLSKFIILYLSYLQINIFLLNKNNLLYEWAVLLQYMGSYMSEYIG